MNGKMNPTARQRFINNITLQGDGEVSVGAGFNHDLWTRYKDDLEKVVLEHEWCFPGYRKGQTPFEPVDYGPAYREGEYYTDAWGSVWYNVRGCMEGQISKHPLEDMSKFPEYCPPDPIVREERGPRLDWEEYGKGLKAAHDAGEPYVYSVFGDRFFERTHFLMDMENMMIAIAEGNPDVDKVIGMILQHNLLLLNRVLEVGTPDLVVFGDDMGTQKSFMISPASWRRYFKPGYRALFGVCRAAGSFVFLHSDGQISEIFDDLVEIGVNILNCQVSLIGIDRVAKELKGRICISADIDRQYVMPFGTPNDVRDLVKEIVMKLGSPGGGLEMSADIYPDVPLENIIAFLEAAKEYRHYWVGRN